MTLVLFDAVLAIGIVLLAWRSLYAQTLFKGVVLFIAFGLFMALAWVRLDATDIALAEAAIGAGLTGALLLDALGHVAGEPAEAEAVADQDSDDSSVAATGVTRVLFASVAGLVAMLLGAALWQMPQGSSPVHEAVVAAMAGHPVGNQATAVLLDFRAYDTFLEMGVLALAGCGAFLLKTRVLRTRRAEPPVRGSIMLVTLARLLAPLMALLAAYLFWAGTSLSGGAFPAGAVLAAAGVLLFLAGIGREAVVDNTATRLLLVAGLIAFIVAGLATLLAGRPFLAWGTTWTYPAIFLLEAVLTISIGATLALLYTASAKEPSDSAAPEGSP